MKLFLLTALRILLIPTACILNPAAMAATEIAPPMKIAMEEFMVPSGDAGIDLYVRNKHQIGRAHV